VTVASKGLEDILSPFAFGGICHFLKKSRRELLLHKQDNVDGQLISINVLEFVTIIINYCATLHMVLCTNPTNDLYPVLLNVTDNASALS
jgi:hypothetical protein